MVHDHFEQYFQEKKQTSRNKYIDRSHELFVIHYNSDSKINDKFKRNYLPKLLDKQSKSMDLNLTGSS